MINDTVRNIRAVSYFVIAADHCSFSAAARHLGIRTSALSRSIANLENRIGVSLFQRSAVGIRLTDAGQKLAEDLYPSLNHIDAALLRAASAGRGEIGKLRVGIITTLGGGFLRELMEAFRLAHPAVNISVFDGGRRRHLRALRALEIDIAFFTGNAAMPDLDSLHLWCERVHVAMPEGHALGQQAHVTWPELAVQHFMVPLQDPGPEIHDYIIRRLADYSTYPKVTSHAVNLDTLMHMVSMGQGLTVVTEGWQSISVAGVKLIPLIDRDDIVPMSAIWSAQNDNPALRRFVSLAKVMAHRNGSGLPGCEER